MGEANLRFVRGETDTAIRMCMEVIRQDPAVAEPFQTLATLYDGLGKFVQPKKLDQLCIMDGIALKLM